MTPAPLCAGAVRSEAPDRTVLLLYSIVAGLLIGRLLGGRARHLEDVRFTWWPLALAGLAVQLVLFAGPVAERVGAEGPVIYVVSTLAVMAALLRNLALPGLAIVALGALPEPRARHRQRRRHAVLAGRLAGAHRRG